MAISAVTVCQLTVWPYRTLADLYDRDPQWQRLGRLAAEMLYVRKERRELSFLLQNAETRYRNFLRDFPCSSQIPQYYVASYLGIRPQSLSRLKKRAEMHRGA